MGSGGKIEIMALSPVAIELCPQYKEIRLFSVQTTLRTETYKS